jgi:hydroxymethylpyrimidine pyrophosphatase-like HAD family hydrolase
VGNYNGSYIHRPSDKGFIVNKTAINRKLVEQILTDSPITSVIGNALIEDDENTFIYKMDDAKFKDKFHVQEDPNLKQLDLSQGLEIDPYSVVFRLDTPEDT